MARKLVGPLLFTKIVRGWQDGLQDMRVGGIRRLYIPSKLAYGKKGAGSVIPPNAAIVFVVEVLGVDR